MMFLIFLCSVLWQIALSADAKRKNTKMFEEVYIPPNTPVPPREGEMPIPISSLDEVSTVLVCLDVIYYKTAPWTK